MDVTMILTTISYTNVGKYLFWKKKCYNYWSVTETVIMFTFQRVVYTYILA